MTLYQLIMTQNECYKAGKKIIPRGIMVHSTGANNPLIGRYVGPDDGRLGRNVYNNHWNQPMSRRVCVHAFIGKLKDGTVATYQTLPWNHRAWHAGGAANDTHISFEICEDGLTDAVYFNKVYREAVELCAHLCGLYPTINPDNIIGHYEGHQRGLASNHADPRNWFPKHGKSMATFRADVKKLLGDREEVEGVKAIVKTVYGDGISLWSSITKSARVVRVPEGATVDVLEDHGNGWVTATYQGFTGYADGKYLVSVEPVEPKPEPKPEPDMVTVDKAALLTELEGLNKRQAVIIAALKGVV